MKWKKNDIIYPVYEGYDEALSCEIIDYFRTEKEANDLIEKLKKENPEKNYWTRKEVIL